MTRGTRTRWALPALAAAPALAVTLAACNDPKPSHSYECRCEYVTDTDVPGIQDVRVCVPEGTDPRSTAAECAQGLGVGHVDRCTCPASTEPCTGPACEQAAAGKSR